MRPPLLTLLLLLSAYAPAEDTLPQAAAQARSMKFSGKTSRAVTAKVKAAECAEAREAALSQFGFAPFPAQYEEASRILSRLPSRLREANDLKLPGLCPVILLPGQKHTARNFVVTMGNGDVMQFVLITTGMLRDGVKNDSQLAFVVAHEMHHIVSGNFPDDVLSRIKQSAAGPADSWPDTPEFHKDLASFRGNELDADRGGALYLVTAGYKFDDVLPYFESDSEGNPLYPTYDERLQALRAQSESLRAIKTAGAAPAVRDEALASIGAAPLDENAPPYGRN